MKNFDYVRPTTVPEAVSAAAEPGAVYLAAGTNLLDLMKGDVTKPDRLVDVTHLPDLDRIEDLADGSARIGALVRNADLAHDCHFARRFPAVAEALLSGASAQLRNAATVGGNLLQRTRCAYFYDPASACNKRKPGSGCDARGGDNRLHAILGWSASCIATHPSDFCVALVALDAVVEIEGKTGRREIPLEAFHRLPGDRPDRETMLEPGEMIVAVRLPAEAAGLAAHARYLKVRDRTSYAFAIVSAAAALRIEAGVIAQARIAMGGVERPARPSACPRCPVHRLPPFPEFSPMPEIALTQTPIHIRHGSNIGQPLTRRDGVLKVTGAAKYAADQHPPGMLYAVLATSSIARGRVAHLDVAAAKAHPGVVEVITPANRPALAQDPDEKSNPFMFRLDLLQNDRVRYVGQPIAVVIAETLEAATEGASLLAPRYEAKPARVGLDSGETFTLQAVGPGFPAQAQRGDVENELAAAKTTITQTYETAAQYHNPIEPHAIVAAWQGDTLSIDTPSQGMAMAQGRLAGLFGISPDKIHIRSPFLGGGFGSKGLMSGPQVLGAIAARGVGRPVKLVLRRDQMFGPVGHRAPTRQTLRLGTDGDGALVALDHRTKTMSSTFDDFFEPASNVSQTLYASTAIATSHEGVRADIGTPLFMRAPGEAPGSIALESAIDEMAQACGMDPLDFRRVVARALALAAAGTPERMPALPRFTVCRRFRSSRSWALAAAGGFGP
jgi:CO/xanthine dehydrogenase FAD-binding subunit